jgi:hypothetical protein
VEQIEEGKRDSAAFPASSSIMHTRIAVMSRITNRQAGIDRTAK